MSIATGTPPAFVCTVGDLLPGTQYHDPNGETWMVLALPRTAAVDGPVLQGISVETDTYVVNVGNGAGNRFGNALCNDEFKGKVTPVRSSVKLGYDHRGRLYASTFLNEWYCEPEADNQDDAPI